MPWNSPFTQSGERRDKELIIVMDGQAGLLYFAVFF